MYLSLIHILRAEESSCRLSSGFQMSSFAQRYAGGSTAASAPALCLRVSAMSFRPVSYTHLSSAQGKSGAKARPRGVVDAHTVEIP